MRIDNPFLHGIGRHVRVSQHDVGRPEGNLAVSTHELGKGSLVSASGRSNQLFIRRLAGWTALHAFSYPRWAAIGSGSSVGRSGQRRSGGAQPWISSSW